MSAAPRALMAIFAAPVSQTVPDNPPDSAAIGIRTDRKV